MALQFNRSKFLFLYTLLLTVLPVQQNAAQSTTDYRPPVKRIKRIAIGPKVGGNVFSLQVNQYLADKYHVYNTDERYQGYRLGVFARMEPKKYYLQAELSYFHNTSFVQFRNLKPNEDWREGVTMVWDYTGPVYTFRRGEITLMGGCKLNKLLRLQAGVVLGYHFYDNFYRHSEQEYQQYPMLRNDRIWHDFAFTYRRLQTSGRVGLGADIGRFTVDAIYETNLTPVSKRIPYGSSSYPLRQSSYLWQIDIGYKLVRL